MFLFKSTLSTLCLFFACSFLVTCQQSDEYYSFDDEFEKNEREKTLHQQYNPGKNDDYNFPDYDEDGGTNDVGNDALILSHVLFRHGNRTADSIAELYPNDPYLNKTYFPYGLGQLTNAGKRREYSIGTALRFRYQNFLGELYYPQIVEAISTDYNRTKMSLQLALAGLFPPVGIQNWKEFIDWQPVPYNYAQRSADRLLLGVSCPNYLRIYEKVRRSVEWQNEFRKFRRVFNYISKNSGLNVTSFQEVYNLYFGISTEAEYGLRLPKWTRAVWPRAITNLAIREYYVSTATTDLRKMASGYLLQKIIADSYKKINDIKSSNDENGRKIHLYSAHENNVAQFLILLDAFRQLKPHIPNYGAYVFLELHRVNGVYGFRLYYENYDNAGGPRLLRIPSCGSFCPIDRFASLYSRYMPTPQLCGN